MATMNALPAKDISVTLGAVGSLMAPPDLPNIELPPLQSVRQFRISIALPVEVVGIDLHGNEFSDVTYTEQVSSHGANLVLNRQLGPDQQLLLKRNGSQAVARAVGQIGIRDMNVRVSGFLYAVALPEITNQQLWNVVFPPDANGFTNFQMYCDKCKDCVTVALDEIKRSVLEINHRLCRTCSICATATFWSEVKESISSSASQTETSPEDRRKQRRVKMKTSACICRPGEEADVAQALDISRGGLSFRSSHEYIEDTWVRIAVPYTPGNANIFVAGRIAWRRSTASDMWEYGVQYEEK